RVGPGVCRLLRRVHEAEIRMEYFAGRGLVRRSHVTEACDSACDGCSFRSELGEREQAVSMQGIDGEEEALARDNRERQDGDAERETLSGVGWPRHVDRQSRDPLCASVTSADIGDAAMASAIRR